MSGPSAEGPVRPDIVGFLRARLDEDEAAAKAGRFYRKAIRPSHARWYAYREGGNDGYAVEDEGGNGGFIVGQEGVARHIARHDPARVLREVEAKRRIVDEYEAAADYEGQWFGEFVISQLALPYSDHPDYDPAWRPS